MTPTEKILEQIRESQKLSEGAIPGWQSECKGQICADYSDGKGGEVHETLFSTVMASVDDVAFVIASREGWPRTLRQLEEAVKALEQASCDCGGQSMREPHSARCNWTEAQEALSRIAALAEEK